MKLFKLKTCAFIFLFLTSCTSQLADRPISYSDNRDALSSDVKSKVVSDDLRQVNFITILPARVSSRTADGISEDLLQSLLQKSAEERLDFEVKKNATNIADVDALLLFNLTNYQKLVGSSVGASHGAEIGFKMTLINSRTRRLLWQSNFFHRDVALSDDFLALGRKQTQVYGWNNAITLLKKSIDRALQDLNTSRKELFLGNKK